MLLSVTEETVELNNLSFWQYLRTVMIAKCCKVIFHQCIKICVFLNVIFQMCQYICLLAH